MIDNEWDELSFPEVREQPRWTARKVIYLVVVLLTLIVFVLYTLWPAFFPPAPPIPVSLPHQQV